MTTADYSIVAPDLDALTTSQCRLLIKANSRFLHYVIIHNNNTVVALKYYQFIPAEGKAITEWLDEVAANDDLLKKEWAAVDLIYAVPESQLIPAGLFKENPARELLEITNGDLKKGSLSIGKIDNAAIYTIFQVPTEMQQFFRNNFTTARIKHYYDLWMQEETNDGVYAVFYPNELLVKVIKQNKLQLIQTYTYQTPEDAAYYLLAIYAQYEFFPEEAPLHISGMIVRESAIYDELLKYFRTIETCDMPASLTLAAGFEDYPSHFFSPILKLAVCAS